MQSHGSLPARWVTNGEKLRPWATWEVHIYLWERFAHDSGFYDQQLAISRKIGDSNGESNAIWGIAICFKKGGDTTQAFAHA